MMRLGFFILILFLLWYCDAKRKRKDHGRKHGPKHRPGHGPKHQIKLGTKYGRKHGPKHGPKYGTKHGPKYEKHNQHVHRKEHEREVECENEYDSHEYGQKSKRSKHKHGHKKHGPGKHGPGKYRHGRHGRRKYGYKVKCPPKTMEPIPPSTLPPVTAFPKTTTEERKRISLECGVAKLANKKEISFSLFAGATQSKEGHHPWHVSIHYRGVFVCSGILISSVKVVTAANCFNFLDKDVKNYQVTCGDHTLDEEDEFEQIIPVANISMHEEYSEDFEDNENDIATIRLDQKVKLNDYITPICLPSADEEITFETIGYVTGWGESNEQSLKLKEYEIPVRDRSVCNQRNKFSVNTVNQNMICGVFSDNAVDSDGCRGDGGSPLLARKEGRWTFYGINSWGSPTCSGSNRFTVFTRVSKYVAWINNT